MHPTGKECLSEIWQRLVYNRLKPDSPDVSFMGECGEYDGFHTFVSVLHKRKLQRELQAERKRVEE